MYKDIQRFQTDASILGVYYGNLIMKNKILTETEYLMSGISGLARKKEKI